MKLRFLITCLWPIVAACTPAPADAPPSCLSGSCAEPADGPPQLGTISGTFGSTQMEWATYDHPVGDRDSSVWIDDNGQSSEIRVVGYAPGSERGPARNRRNTLRIRFDQLHSNQYEAGERRLREATLIEAGGLASDGVRWVMVEGYVSSTGFSADISAGSGYADVSGIIEARLCRADGADGMPDRTQCRLLNVTYNSQGRFVVL